MNNKVIITCAVTGGIHTPTMSPHLPITPSEIAASAIEAAEAGAAIIHLHARDPETGKPTQNPDLFMEFLPRIKQSTNAVLNLTTGGGLGMTLVERLAPAHRAQPEVTSLNMGSMNFSVAQLAEKQETWKFDWEKPYLENSWKSIYPNTFEMIERVMIDVGQAYDTRFEFECYDIGHLYNLKQFVDRRLVKPPFFIQGIFGISGGIGADLDNLMYFKQKADQLFGSDYKLSAFGIGRAQMSFLTMAALLGGNVRVGLEDSLFIGRRKLASSNAEQVSKIRRILEELGKEIATPEEARQILGLKGGDRVAF
ncbi:3-keto-5-aminohexanoate cleavage protein [Mesorhizobium sp. CO1-1-8]|uniref:3-keto-5-aminohexanoate cleavage protein n=1 Tax=Mesorhizobium sp. CO1-1-8 TaxID=2876631 RepID=UPI001CD05F42|nr:3-keto-5-aminohexanoate cleavage protein [Mesorhizobium sp. CO1-1-8]MBZ9772214.1 3-keto-5-aminohexanoate cleavage protein [Mesorhizobium sp. CO1-1-8]